MGARGLYGFRKNGEDKCTYNHWDSYPSGLGYDVVEFCKKHSIRELNDICNKIVMVNQNDTPTEKQINDCIKNEFADFSVGSGEQTDWYCLLRKCQGNLERLAKAKEHAYMINNNDFIKDSLWCEYAYIINLDDEILEFYKGFQEIPQEGNRYGTEDDRGYYPCKLSLVFSLDEIDDVDKIVEMMNLGEDAEEIYEIIEDNSDYDLTLEEAKELVGKDIIDIFCSIEELAEQNARGLGYLTDHNERYFNLDLYGEDLLKNGSYIELESTGRVAFVEN